MKENPSDCMHGAALRALALLGKENLENVVGFLLSGSFSEKSPNDAFSVRAVKRPPPAPACLRLAPRQPGLISYQSRLFLSNLQGRR